MIVVTVSPQIRSVQEKNKINNLSVEEISFTVSNSLGSGKKKLSLLLTNKIGFFL